jgi:hypothetical protein
MEDNNSTDVGMMTIKLTEPTSVRRNKSSIVAVDDRSIKIT